MGGTHALKKVKKVPPPVWLCWFTLAPTTLQPLPQNACFFPSYKAPDKKFLVYLQLTTPSIKISQGILENGTHCGRV